MAVSFFSAACAAGLPTFTAISKFSVRAPQMPPWPLQRSMTATRVLGIRRSISAALAPMFWARAWQARCTLTPPSTGSRPGARPSFLAMSTTYSRESKVACDSRSTAGSLGRISGHSNFSISAQDGVSATTS